MGTLIANPRKRPAKISICAPCVMPAPCACDSNTMSNVWPTPGMSVLKYSARKLSSMSAEPNSVKRKNLIDAYSRFGPPQTPIMKNIGSRTISKNTKNRIRSWATKVPFIPTSSTSISARNAFGLTGSGKWFQE
jgi:hypothetical protein